MSQSRNSHSSSSSPTAARTSASYGSGAPAVSSPSSGSPVNDARRSTRPFSAMSQAEPSHCAPK
ncbi:hypothetical protein [Streptomyces sp. NPDC006274]|uniref:hypothetical protein n=1 Tax=unclassified Streptomyces TaxID=2593676 RepID=UPI0033B45CFD